MYLKFKRAIKSILSDSNRKPIAQIFKEFFTLWLINKEIPSHYFSRFLYRKDFVNYKNYLSTKQYFKLIRSKKIQNKTYVKILENKYLFALFCEKNSLPVPKLLAHNAKEHFYFNNKSHTIKNHSELTSFLREIFDVYNISKIIIKKINDKGGTGIFLIPKNNLKKYINEFGNEILSDSYIIQEVITQHESINNIYSKSINTLRLDVIVDDFNTTHLLGSVMRFGANGNQIDNRSKGGFFVSIDDQTGCLLKKGYKKMGFGGTELIKHPDSNFAFEGFKIPYYKEAKELVLSCSKLIPNKIIGWDIAITPNGPIIIEGNHDSNLTMTEINNDGYLNHPLIKDL